MIREKLAQMPNGKKRLIAGLIALGLLALLIASGGLILHSHGASDPAVPVTELDPMRSQIMVTGEEYTLNASQNVAMEKEEEERAQIQQTQPAPKPSQIGAPNQQTNQISRRYTIPHYTPTHRPTTPTTTPVEKDESDPTPTDDTNSKTDDPTKEDEPTDADLPKITTDLTNGETIDGKLLSFYMEAKSASGTKIPASNFTVKVNGTEIYGTGTQYRGLYSCSITGDSSSPLVNGRNTVTLRAKDSAGNKTTASLRITMNAEAEAEEDGYAKLTITANNVGLGTIYSSGDQEIYKNEKIAHFFKRVMKKSGISYKSSGTEDSGFYLARLEKPGILNGYSISPEAEAEIGKTMTIPESMDSLGEKDFFPQSGWMFSVNGETPDSGMASGTIQDGDEVVVWFTLDGGNDGGNDEATN